MNTSDQSTLEPVQVVNITLKSVSSTGLLKVYFRYRNYSRMKNLGFLI